MVLGGGMTAVTGETGAGKTLVVGAIDLLTGGRATGALVGPGGAEAEVEGRFVTGDSEVVLRRVIPADGRSRAYIDGHLATAAALEELGRDLVDLHGQHNPSVVAERAPIQRSVLDSFGAVETATMAGLVDELRAIEAGLGELGGDARAPLPRDRSAAPSTLRDRRGCHLRSRRGRAPRPGRVGAGRCSCESPGGCPSDEAAQCRQRGVGRAGPRSRPSLPGGSPSPASSPGSRTRQPRSPTSRPRPGRAWRPSPTIPPPWPRCASGGSCWPDCGASTHGSTLQAVLDFGSETARRLDELEGYETRAATLETRRSEVLERLGAEQARVRGERCEAAPRLAAAVESHLAELSPGQGPPDRRRRRRCRREGLVPLCGQPRPRAAAPEPGGQRGRAGPDDAGSETGADRRTGDAGLR